MNNKKVESVLKLNNLVYDKIDFQRQGFKTNAEFKFNISSEVYQSDENYRVTLKLEGEKEAEYTVYISLSGFFTLDSQCNLTEKDIETLITKNGVAIMMPYLRNQLSILTAQPETDAVVLPIFNINNMLD
ncbi:MAG: Preprotein translocase subunit SecB [Anaerostipes sp.]